MGRWRDGWRDGGIDRGMDRGMEGWMNGRRPEYCMFYRLACYLQGVWNDIQFRTIRYGTGVYTGRRTCVRVCVCTCMYSITIFIFFCLRHNSRHLSPSLNCLPQAESTRSFFLSGIFRVKISTRRIEYLPEALAIYTNPNPMDDDT